MRRFPPPALLFCFKDTPQRVQKRFPRPLKGKRIPFSEEAGIQIIEGHLDQPEEETWYGHSVELLILQKVTRKGDAEVEEDSLPFLEKHKFKILRTEGEFYRICLPIGWTAKACAGWIRVFDQRRRERMVQICFMGSHGKFCHLILRNSAKRRKDGSPK